MGNKPLSNRLQKDRMMKKAGAGALCFVVGLWLTGSVWAGEEGAAAAPEQAAEAVVEAVAVEAAPADEPVAEATADAVSPRAKAAERLEAVKDLSLDELKGKLAETEAALPGLNQKLGELARAAQETRETAAANSPEIKDLYVQIRALHERIAALTETLPEVQKKTAEQTAVRAELLGEMDFRTRLMGLIRQKEAAEAAQTGAEDLP